ncbi:MAG: complex I subunit 5 family protein [bacterium]
MTPAELPITLKESSIALMPLVIVLVPVIGAILVAVCARCKAWAAQNAVIILTCLVSLGLILALYHPVVRGVYIEGVFYKGLDLSLPGIMGFHLRFGADSAGLIFALITSFIWTLSATFGTSYMVKRHAKGRFFTFYMLGLASCLGIYLVRDFFSLFIFFEFVTITCYALVAHDETGDATFAGKLFLYVSVIGGLCMLFGTILMYGYTGNISLYPSAELTRYTTSALPGLVLTPRIRFLIFFLLVAGFAIKAGLWLVHIWLPVAHPVAPPPAHAVLSGLVVKVGIYGMLRTIFRLYPAMPLTHGAQMNMIGVGVIWLGVLTMFFGALPALLTTHFKRMFAFSTVSQMGFIVFGLGCCMVLGTEGAMGLAGSLYYIMNHAVFKSAFFLCIGITCSRTNEDYIEKMGGMRKNMPITALTFLFAVLSIAGIPFTGGFASKTMVHHAITEAIAHFGHAHAAGIAWLKWAEIMFIISAGMTLCYTTRSFYLVYMGKRPDYLKNAEPETNTMRAAFIPMIISIILIGLFPNFLLEKLIGPALAGFGLQSGSHAYKMIFDVNTGRSALPLLYNPVNFSLGSMFSHEVLHNVSGVGIVALSTVGWYLIGIFGKMFSIRVPEYLNLKNWYVVISRLVVFIFSQLCAGLEFVLNGFLSFLLVDFWQAQEAEGEQEEERVPLLAQSGIESL